MSAFDPKRTFVGSLGLPCLTAIRLSWDRLPTVPERCCSLEIHLFEREYERLLHQRQCTDSRFCYRLRSSAAIGFSGPCFARRCTTFLKWPAITNLGIALTSYSGMHRA